MSDIPESEKIAEWDRIERALHAAQLWDGPAAELFCELRKCVILDRRPPTDGLSATVTNEDVRRLMPLLAQIPLPRRQQISSALHPLSAAGLVRYLHNQILLDTDITETRQLFGLTDTPDPGFREAAERAIIALFSWRSKNEQLLQEIRRETPERLQGRPDHKRIADLCTVDLDVLSFVEGDFQKSCANCRVPHKAPSWNRLRWRTRIAKSAAKRAVLRRLSKSWIVWCPNGGDWGPIGRSGGLAT
jgi:hypothetical protein